MPKLSVKVEQGVGSISTSSSGRDVALASRNGLLIFDTHEPYSPPRWLPLHTAWEVAGCHWCPHPKHPSWVVTTANQKAILWNLMLSTRDAIEHVLHGHQRAITDVIFSKDQQDLLATTSIDTMVHVWDMREPDQPALSFSDFLAAGAQVKWSKTNPFMLASSHDHRVKLWDIRKNSLPVRDFVAHIGKANTIDFSDQSNLLVSGSTDRSIRFWDLDGPETAPKEAPNLVSEVKTLFPVWRVRHLPKSECFFACPLRGGENATYMFVQGSGSRQFDPLVTSKFHTSPIHDLSLRRDGDGYDLITWGLDNNLIISSVDMDIVKKAGGVSELSDLLDTSETYSKVQTFTAAKPLRRGFSRVLSNGADNGNSQLKWIAGVELGVDAEIGSVLPRFATSSLEAPVNTEQESTANVSREVTMMNTLFPQIGFESIDLSAGKCSIVFKGPWGASKGLLTLRMSVYFPSGYPFKPLVCQIEEDPLVEASLLAEMDEFLSRSTAELANHGKESFEFCMRYLLGEPVALESVLQAQTPDIYDGFDASSSDDDDYGARATTHEIELVCQDTETQTNNMPILNTNIDSTPLPKACGAIWCPDGRLVCFFNNAEQQQHASQFPPLERIFSLDSHEGSDLYESDEDDSDVLNNTSTLKWTGRTNQFELPHRMTVGPDSDLSDLLRINSASTVNSVLIVNIQERLPCRADIAAEYILNFKMDASAMAIHNAKVADNFGRHEDAYMWRYVQHYCESMLYWSGKPHQSELLYLDWSGHPFDSQEILGEILAHLNDTGNYQLLTGLTCVLLRAAEQLLHGLDGHEKPYLPFKENVMLCVPHASGDWKSVQTQRATQYDLQPLLFPKLSLEGGTTASTPRESELEPQSFPFRQAESLQTGRGYVVTMYTANRISYNKEYVSVDMGVPPESIDSLRTIFEKYSTPRELYARMLGSWGLHIQRLEVLKFNTIDPGYRRTATDSMYVAEIQQFKRKGAKQADVYTMTCVFCNQLVRTRVCQCANCNHILHQGCAATWWSDQTECPSGCGCACLEYI